MTELHKGDRDFVVLDYRFTSGWPWPEDSWGLNPMFGEDGWCHSCGVPRGPQTGSLVVQGNKFPTGPVWVPNWQFDLVCLREDVARDLLSRFRLDALPVRTPRGDETGVMQLVVSPTNRSWYDVKQLGDREQQKHGEAGEGCPECGVWRWFPLSPEELPPAHTDDFWEGRDVVASPEWFGSGCSAYREKLFRRPLAEAIVGASPRVWSIVEPAITRK